VSKIFHASAGMGKELQGRALVAKDGFSARYDLDRIKGVFSRPEHKLAGESYVGRVLVLDAAKGGVATAWMLYEMQSRGVMPAALVLNAVNPIMAQGVALADFTMISGFDCDITQAIPNGAEVELDPNAERPFIRVLGYNTRITPDTRSMIASACRKRTSSRRPYRFQPIQVPTAIGGSARASSTNPSRSTAVVPNAAIVAMCTTTMNGW
jgi:predicted aconitase with swiveling domain